MSKEVQAMFASIAHRYDAANDVLSFGFHRWWRRRAVELLDVRRGNHILDLCTGTGDLALLLAEKVGPEGEVYGVDFVPKMLELAESKERTLRGVSGAAANTAKPVQWIHGDAMNIPFPDQSMDRVTIAFGIRNVDDPLACLREIFRVLKPGGRLVVIEFGQPRLPVFSSLFRWYSAHLMPRIGGAVTGNRAAYEYLPKTSQAFPCREKFEALMAKGGFARCATRSLFGGIAFLYTGERTSGALRARETDDLQLQSATG